MFKFGRKPRQQPQAQEMTDEMVIRAWAPSWENGVEPMPRSEAVAWFQAELDRGERLMHQRFRRMEQQAVERRYVEHLERGERIPSGLQRLMGCDATGMSLTRLIVGS